MTSIVGRLRKGTARGLAHVTRKRACGESGASAVEFALIAPVFCLILVGAVAFGGVLYTKFGLDGAASAAADYAANNASNVNSTSGWSLANSLASIVAGAHAGNWANATVVVNNGPSATLTGGTITSGGTASNADSCYCPTGNALAITWGAAKTCGSACTGTGVAGKFVSIVAVRTYSPISSYRHRHQPHDRRDHGGGSTVIRALRTFCGCSRGTGAVEFGMVALPLLLLIFGTMEYGRLMWTREALQQTAIAGTRCMGMTQTACGTAGVYSASMAASYVQTQAAAWSVSLKPANITLNNAATCGGVSGFSQVSLVYTFSAIVPKLITALAGGAQLTATACFPNHP